MCTLPLPRQAHLCIACAEKEIARQKLTFCRLNLSARRPLTPVPDAEHRRVEESVAPPTWFKCQHQNKKQTNKQALF